MPSWTPLTTLWKQYIVSGPLFSAEGDRIAVTLSTDPLPDPTAGPQDLASIDAMLSDYAARLPKLCDVSWKAGSGIWRRKDVDDQLRARFRCSAFRPCEFSEAMIRNFPGFQQLDAKAKEMDVAVSVAVCHFKPGPDAEGMWRVKNPEALVVIRVEADKTWSESEVRLYEDAFKTVVFRPFALKRPAPEESAAKTAPKL
jgi:hypothetical protein